MLSSASMNSAVLLAKADDYYASDRTEFLDWVGGEHLRVLDVGCGAGANAAWYRQHGAREIVGIEIDPTSAARSAAVFDRVICQPVETAVHMLEGSFDLIVCADVLEHLVDPWSVVRELGRLADADTCMAISVPNIRFLPALVRIAFGRGFAYEERGIFDSTHLRFFTRRDAALMLRRGGWVPQHWGAPQFRRLGSVRRLAQRSTKGRSDEWLAGQLYAVARPAPAR
jgi:2-polyprenyl-3-methyl-5-hydroxy-6-metoxy-1,4-benzoquinol methylase